MLGHEFYEHDWKQHAIEVMAANDLPFFRPVAKALVNTLPGKVRVRFECDRLTPAGRCGDYENRPFTCRSFVPASDPLCAEHVRKLNGIPIRVEMR
jgi:Fe-S-cluster containining protein